MNGRDLSTGQRNADSRPLLEIQLFGRFLAKIDGAAVEEKRWERRSAKALVKLLSLKPSYTLHREQIIDLLWPEQGAESAVTRFIGEGVPLVLSPDDRQVILRIPAKDSHLTLLNIETGETRLLEDDRDKPSIHSEYVSYFPDGRRIAFEATEPSGGSRIHFQDLTGGKPVCFTPGESGVGMRSNHSASPDGAWIMLVNSANHVCLYRIADGRPDVLDELGSGFFPAGWMAGGKDILLRRWGDIPLMVYRYNLASGTLEEWLALDTGRHSGATMVLNLRLAPDGRSYAYGIRKE